MPRVKRAYKHMRRYRKTLAGRNIQQYMSARAQARQILALRNRISAVARNCRPETQLHTFTGGATFSNSTFAATYQQWLLTPAGNNITGQWLHSKGLSVRGVVEYSDNYQNVVAADHQRTCTFRILIFAKVVSGNNDIPVANIIDLANTGTGYELNALRPLKRGLTSYAKIYYDKSYTISAQNPIKKFAISIKRLMNLHKETNDTHPRGEIAFAVITSGLHWDNSYTQELRLSFISNFAYNDTN